MDEYRGLDNFVMYDSSLYLWLEDSIFKEYFKSGEIFKVFIEGSTKSMDVRFRYEGDNAAITWWDLPQDYPTDLMNIIKTNGTVKIYYNEIGYRKLKLIGNDNAINAYENCEQKFIN